ncbi:MAG TPA: YggT family protein [Steroidobacteraceae bacterium]|nr:YggT family protein [Steroidobacteraceae bacterium]HRX88816.1 YggT family protein [Steroidobacteraceae bacterium]
MEALVYIVSTLMSLYMYVLLLRFIMQLVRANFRNPLAQAIVKLSNPIILPLRRLLPPAGRIDTASIVAIALYALATVAILWGLRGGFGPVAPLLLLQAALYEILRSTLWLYFVAIFVYAMLSFVAPGAQSPVNDFLYSICEPVLMPIRRIIPPIGGLDLSPLWAGIAIQALLILLR